MTTQAITQIFNTRGGGNYPSITTLEKPQDRLSKTLSRFFKKIANIQPVGGTGSTENQTTQWL